MFMIRALIFIAFAVMFSTNSFAQEGKVSIFVSHSGDDSVGRQLVFSVKEILRGSRAFQLSSQEDSAMQIRVITVNPEDGNSSTWAVASVVYTMTNFLPYEKGNPQTWYAIYAGSQVLTVGMRRVDDQAKSIVAFLDSALEKYRQDAKNSR